MSESEIYDRNKVSHTILSLPTLPLKNHQTPR